MATLRKTVLATAMISAGLLSGTGMALADDTTQEGGFNSSDFAPNTTGEACNNDVPVNVLGVQVPVQDDVLGLPIASKAHHGNGAANAKSCSNGIDASN